MQQPGGIVRAMDRRSVVIDRPRTVFVDALRRHDAGAACAVYAANARLLPPAAGAVVGREQIRAFWEAGLSSGISDVEYQPSELRGEGDVMCEVGRYTLRFDTVDGGPLEERGHYVHVHERQPDGSWLRTVDMFTPGGGE
jgi:ketosteroid isomerase-like protein